MTIQPIFTIEFLNPTLHKNHTPYLGLHTHWRAFFVRVSIYIRGHRSSDRMVIGFTTTYVIGAYYHLSYTFEPRSWRGVLDTTLCDTVCQ